MGFWSELGKELVTKLGEQTIYERGFNDGKAGQPRQVWRYKTQECKGLYNKGYEDGLIVRLGGNR
jgi:hypothetical protein